MLFGKKKPVPLTLTQKSVVVLAALGAIQAVAWTVSGIAKLLPPKQVATPVVAEKPAK